MTLAIEDINAAGGVLGGPVATVRAEESVDEPLETTLDALVGRGRQRHPRAGRLGERRRRWPLLAREQRCWCARRRPRRRRVTAGGVAARSSGPRCATTTPRPSSPTGSWTPARGGRRAAAARSMILGHDDVYGTELAGELSAQLTARGATVDTIAVPRPPGRVRRGGRGRHRRRPRRRWCWSSLRRGRRPLDRARRGRLPGRPHRRSRRYVASPTSPTSCSPTIRRGPTGSGDPLRPATALSPSASPTCRAERRPHDLRRPDVRLRDHDRPRRHRRRLDRSGRTSARQIRRVTSGGRTCSTFAHCAALLDAGEDIAYAGASGGLDIDDAGRHLVGRMMTSTVVDGVSSSRRPPTRSTSSPCASQQFLAAPIVTTQLQQVMKALGYYDGDVNGYVDEATADAVRALQARPRRPRDRRVRRGDRCRPAGPARRRRGGARA